MTDKKSDKKEQALLGGLSFLRGVRTRSGRGGRADQAERAEPQAAEEDGSAVSAVDKSGYRRLRRFPLLSDSRRQTSSAAGRTAENSDGDEAGDRYSSRLQRFALGLFAFSLAVGISTASLLIARELGIDGARSTSPERVPVEIETVEGSSSSQPSQPASSADQEADVSQEPEQTPAFDVSSLPFPQAGYLRLPQVRVREEPSMKATEIKKLDRFRGDFRPTVVFAVGAELDEAGRLWYRVSVPGRPNGRYGWALGDNLRLGVVEQRIVVDRSERALRYYEGDELLLETEVAVGKPGAETPLGRFYVTAMYKATAPILGAYAIETSAYSKLSDWPGGGIVGIHGTPYPELLGQAVSHGCIRLRNEDILKLKDLVPVGAEVEIVA